MNTAFQLIVLGCLGGPFENNLSGFLLAPQESSNFVALDAGTLLAGIQCAIKKGSFDFLRFTDSTLTQPGEILRKHVQAFLISHAHLDHIAGLVVNSQSDGSKQILGIDSTIDNLRDHIFNGLIWANFGNEGKGTALGQYEYVRLPLHKEQPISHTDMHVEAYLLSHPGGYPSSAFLIRHQENYILYFGDTSSDFFEEEKHLERIWSKISPLIKNRKLHAILLECSYPKRNEKTPFFGHLNTKYMLKELGHLASKTDKSIHDVAIIVIHRKESLEANLNPVEDIARELTENDTLNLRFIFPTQGDRILV